jgi:ATP-dependent RNA helicase DHX57
MGSLLGCRSAALAIAAGMSVGRSPFLKVITNRRGNGDNDESKDEIRNRSIMEQRENLFKIVGNSDHVMLAAAYMAWESMHGGGGDKRRYLESLGLSINGVRDMKQLYNQLDSSLSNAGYHSTKESNMNMNSFRIIRSCVVSALAPAQIVRVQRPGTKYAATVEGAVEKDGVARELRFYTRGEISDGDDSTNEAKHVVKFYHGIPEERVFIHPSSANFSVGAYSCPWLVFHDLVRTSKAFLRDATECSTYDILLFGGKIDVQAAAGVIQIDNYVHLSANARIGELRGSCS